MQKAPGACQRPDCPCTGKKNPQFAFCCKLCAGGRPCAKNYHGSEFQQSSKAPSQNLQPQTPKVVAEVKEPLSPARPQGLKPMKDYLGSDVTLWLEDHFLSGLRPSFVEHGIVGENFRDLTLPQMQRLKMGTEQLQTSFIRFRDQQLKEETGQPERVMRRALLYKDLNDLRRTICKKLHADGKVEEIREISSASTPLLSELLKLDWHEELELCELVSKMVEVPRKESTKQQPKQPTPEYMLLVGAAAQPLFVKALEEWIATVGLSPDCLIIGDVKKGARVTSKAMEGGGVQSLFDLNRATILCKKVAQVLNLTNTVMVMFIQPMTFKNKFNTEGTITQPPCLFYQIGLRLTGAAASMLETPDTPWIVEVQLTTEQFYDTKKYAHEFYDITREQHNLPVECPFCLKPTQHGLAMAGKQHHETNEEPTDTPSTTTTTTTTKTTTTTTASSLTATSSSSAAVTFSPTLSASAETQAQAQASVIELESFGGLEMDEEREDADEEEQEEEEEEEEEEESEEEEEEEEQKEEQANGPEVVATKTKKGNDTKDVLFCTHCSEKGHSDDYCFKLHPEKQLEAVMTAIRMIVGQFGHSLMIDQPRVKSIPLTQLAQLWRHYASTKPGLFRGFTLGKLAEKDPSFLRVDNETGLCTMITHFSPCAAVAAGGQCTSPHGLELRHQCLFGVKCPVASVCVFHKHSPPPVAVKQMRLKDPSKSSRKGPRSKFDKVLIALISQFGKECEGEANNNNNRPAKALSVVELTSLVGRYNQDKPHKALPDMTTILAASQLTVNEKEVVVSRPHRFCTVGGCHCNSRHKCEFSKAGCPDDTCKLLHSKAKAPRHKSPKPPRKPKEPKEHKSGGGGGYKGHFKGSEQKGGAGGEVSSSFASPPKYNKKADKKTVAISKRTEVAKFLWANRKAMTATGCRITLNAAEGGDNMEFSLTGTSEQIDQAVAVMEDLVKKLTA